MTGGEIKRQWKVIEEKFWMSEHNENFEGKKGNIKKFFTITGPPQKIISLA